MKISTRLGSLMALAAAGTLAVPVGMASAAPSSGSTAVTCTGGEIASGTYSSVTIAGNCSVPAHATVMITGNLNVLSGARLDADSAPSTITVGHNVTAAPGSSTGLGCTAAHGGCTSGGPDGNGPYAGEMSNILIKGNASFDHVFNAALNGITVNGNVTSVGGGGGGGGFPEVFIPFSVKDDTIHGNLSVSGLTSTWFGVIRSTIDGNVALSNIWMSDPDGNEIVHDTIGKNLICTNMSPAPQFGDADDGIPDPSYPYSTVGRNALGQCGFVLAP
ncbi:MAG TPA: hypothetical protein VG502_16160 [Flexivirga sp.]|uniref:hypothetical protein n=1 Tax=Flexivirga sp. TaxID=1962927 RepID=UPI002CD78F20|nr:hypothetical protein [Flexivirga sp.]HWC23830.1 hypothetical protein [Flexivirga sp.]